MAYSSYTSNMEHNYTIASKAYNLSFIKVITVCLPYGLIVFMYLPLFCDCKRERQTERERQRERSRLSTEGLIAMNSTEK